MTAKTQNFLLYGGSAVLALGFLYWISKSAQGAAEGTQHAIEGVGRTVDTVGGAMGGGLLGLVVGAALAPETGGLSLVAAGGSIVGAIVGGYAGYEAGAPANPGSTYATPDDQQPLSITDSGGY